MNNRHTGARLKEERIGVGKIFYYLDPDDLESPEERSGS